VGAAFLDLVIAVAAGGLTSPFIFIACLACRVNPLRGVAVMWQILNALADTNVEVEHRSAGMSFHIL
jgi:hypothetical protein